MKSIFALLVLCVVACSATFMLSEDITAADFMSHFTAVTSGVCDGQKNTWVGTDLTIPPLEGAGFAKVLRAAWDGTKAVAPRVKSNLSFGPGTFIVFNITHLPAGDFVWPAVWTVKGTPCSADRWPETGEFDIIESVTVNGDMPNKPAMHSNPGCSIPNVPYQWISNNPHDYYAYTWTPTGTNPPAGAPISCDSSYQGATGCSWVGRPFMDFKAINSRGGGVFAFWWKKSDGSASHFFWNHNEVPSNIRSNPTPALWTPWATFPSTNCNAMSTWSEHNLIIDIKVCGNMQLNGAGCQAPTYWQAYNDQYFGFNDIRRFTEF